MEKRSNVSRDDRTRVKSKRGSVKLEKLTVLEEPKRIWVRNIYPSKVGIVGLSGKKYIFDGAGAEVKVRVEDVEKLLAKRRGGCCGGTPGRVFELV